MMKKKNLPIVLLVLVTGIVVAFRTLAFNEPTPSKYERILHNVEDMINQYHYSPKNIDDNFSREVFKKYLSEVDQEKKNFLHIRPIVSEQNVQLSQKAAVGLTSAMRDRSIAHH